MRRTAKVNYHVHNDPRQAFELDAGGIAGNLISPELAPTQIELADTRVPSVSVSFAKDAVEFARSPSRITDFDDGRDWEALYGDELTRLLTERLGAQDVIVFDHTVRVDDPEEHREPRAGSILSERDFTCWTSR